MVEKNSIAQIDVMLRYFLHIDPDTLTDEEWAIQVKSLEWIRKKESGKK